MSRAKKSIIALYGAVVPMLWAARAAAQEAQATANVDLGTSSEPAGGTNDTAAFLLGAKIGGIVPFNMSPFLAGGLELGWVFAGTNRRVAVLLDVSYATPKASGDETDAPSGRVANSQYHWQLTQKELVFQPTLMYRVTGLGKITPYIGVGPRVYIVESVSQGSAAGVEFGETREHSTKFGVGVPLGAELAMGPGGLFAELLFQWAPIAHDITGDSNLAAATIFIGYRALF